MYFRTAHDYIILWSIFRIAIDYIIHVCIFRCSNDYIIGVCICRSVCYYVISVCIFRTQFTLTELQKRPLPEGVDPARLETYISDEEFKVSEFDFCL